MDKQSISGKRKARKLALQALYQWQMAGADLHEIEAQFHVAKNMDKVDAGFFSSLLHGIPENLSKIDETMRPFLDREIKDLNQIELVVLRLGTYELLFNVQIPYKIVLDEAINLSKSFGSQDGHRYVNGVLNQVARQVRAIEIQADQ